MPYFLRDFENVEFKRKGRSLSAAVRQKISRALKGKRKGGVKLNAKNIGIATGLAGTGALGAVLADKALGKSRYAGAVRKGVLGGAVLGTGLYGGKVLLNRLRKKKNKKR